MYPVSDSYKNALLQKHITDTVSGKIVLKNGTEIMLNDSTIVTGSLRISHELCDDYRIGTFNLGSMNIGFFDDNALGRDFSGARITLDYKIETEAGWETVPLGIFIADGRSVIRRRNTVTLTAYDYGILFDCTLGSTVRNMNGNAENIISAVCERCGVVFGGIADGLPNTNVSFTPSSQRIQSCRDLIGWCAALLCGYAVIDRTGRLKIISARYAVEAEDPSEIIVDKYLTSAERNTIYSTDTRAWIAQMSAYSDGKPKIYKSNITRDDSQAARAVYFLENNPLMEGMSENLCDYINCNWLEFIDGFMQRGITAELYGDPAIDAGDVMRCSEGDIDQRRSVVGLVTKQEWRYRDYHTVICASAQLSDGIEENEEDGTQTSGAVAVGETDNIYPVEVVSQSKKTSSGGGSEYYAGEGLSLNDKTFSLNSANQANLGGIRLSAYATVPDDDGSSDRDCGIYKRDNDAFPSVRRATKKQIGGIYLGDGLAPTVEQNGETYTNTGHVEVRIGEGLEFIENDEAATDIIEKRQNNLGGRAFSVTRATKEKFGSVKLGKRMAIDADGSTYPVMAGGDGIKVSEEGEISVDFDEETLEINGNGQLAVKKGSGEAVSIENAVIIQEADAKYLLHNYTEVHYIAGNKVGYAGPPNPIQLADKDGAWWYILSPNTEALPQKAPFTKMVFPLLASSATATPYQNVDFYMYVSDITNTAAGLQVKSDALNLTWTGNSTYDISISGLYATWTTIYPPNASFPYGYVNMSIGTLIKNNAGEIQRGTTRKSYFIGFTSEAEYNYAVGLTYEPNQVTGIEEQVIVCEEENGIG